MFDIEKKQIIGKHVSLVIPNSSVENFPVKAFYNDRLDEIYVVYRQGHIVTVNQKDLNDFREYRMIEKDVD